MPFKKGDDPNRNTNGRPKKGNTMTLILQNVLEEEAVNFKGEKISGKEAVARKLLELAMSGDVPALKYCYDRMDGTPVQAIRHVDGSGADVKEIDVSRLTREEQEALAKLSDD